MILYGAPDYYTMLSSHRFSLVQLNSKSIDLRYLHFFRVCLLCVSAPNENKTRGALCVCVCVLNKYDDKRNIVKFSK